MNFNKRVIDKYSEENERRVSTRINSSSSQLSDKEIISSLRLEIRNKDEAIETLNSNVNILSKLNNNLTNSNIDLIEVNNSLKLKTYNSEIEITKLIEHVSEINLKYASLLDTKNDLDHLISDYPHKLAIEIINWY